NWAGIPRFDVVQDGAWHRYSVTFKFDSTDRTSAKILLGNGKVGTEFFIRNLKLEKGTKATDWSPAPEDTDAKIEHIETEFTQTFDSFSQTVAGIDGRVTANKQTIDSITQTVTDHTGKIATVEQNVHGIQQTVSDPVNGLVTQVSTLANGLNVLVKDFEDLEVGGRNWVVRANELDGMWIDTAGDVTNGINTAVMRDYIQVEPG